MDTSAAGGGIEVTGPAASAEHPDIEVRRDLPVIVPDPAGRNFPVARLVLAGLAVLLVAGLGAIWLLLGGGDDTVATEPGARTAGLAKPAALTVQVDPPAAAVAGQPVAFVVHYADGQGIFSGSTEDWGDGVGVGSGKVGSCSTPPSIGALSSTYQATHTWAAPGTYPVSFQVTTYTCDGGSAVEENAKTTLDVTVTAP